ncbi:MAG: protein arginine kinase [Lentimonas sp.]|jgi:protein arginine kinase
MIESLLKNERAELTQGAKTSAPVVLSTRLRLARNLSDIPFPERATLAQRSDVLSKCAQHIHQQKQLKGGSIFNIAELSELEKQVLVERHLISRELCENPEGSAVLISKGQTCSIMINEEDHLRIQFLKAGFNLKSIWKQIDSFDTELEKSLNFAFSSEFGFLTACPTNLGTGLRASVMMHLPGLVISNQMERVIRAVNQLGITVRGLFGEGSDATGHVFQISNQQTLGESEGEIIDRLSNVLKTTIEHEINARFKYLELNQAALFDKIGRAYGVLKNAHEISSNEAMNQLSFMRLAVDFNLLPDEYRSMVDRLFIECQPGHIQYAVQAGIEPEGRDITRAEKLREEFSRVPSLDFDKLSKIA